jgi:hypothetical protein
VHSWQVLVTVRLAGLLVSFSRARQQVQAVFHSYQGQQEAQCTEILGCYNPVMHVLLLSCLQGKNGVTVNGTVHTPASGPCNLASQVSYAVYCHK